MRARPVSISVVVATVCLVGTACSGDETNNPRPAPSPVATSPIETPESTPDAGTKITISPSIAPPPDPKPVAGIDMDPLPIKVKGLCIKGPPLERVCPRLAPAVKQSHPYLVDSFGKPGGRFQIVDMAAGAPRDDFARNSPPGVVHVVLETGDPSRLIELTPTNPDPIPLATALASPRPGAVTVDVRKQGWKEKLILAAPFPGGGAHGDHLVYRRTIKGIERRISLHLWAPLREPVQVLKAMVRSANI
ncbi:MAG: hypothetical protein M3285_00750 [Actinomycetota bacterium]|nr:hypothetical protein [Actinomycetota bacterium]